MIQQIDERVARALYQLATDATMRHVMIVLTCIGSSWTAAALAPFFVVRRTRSFAIGLASTLIATGSVVFVMKHAFVRVRPCVALADIHALWGAPTDASFPSGHASGAFAVAAFVTIWLAAEGDMRARLIVTALWMLACGAALSRVCLGVHYPTDVIVAAIIGSAIGILGARSWLRVPALAADPILRQTDRKQ